MDILGCFCVLALMSKVTINVSDKGFCDEHTFDLVLNKYLGMESLLLW